MQRGRLFLTPEVVGHFKYVVSKMTEGVLVMVMSDFNVVEIKQRKILDREGGVPAICPPIPMFLQRKYSKCLEDVIYSQPDRSQLWK
jgi:hypothetical protein